MNVKQSVDGVLMPVDTIADGRKQVGAVVAATSVIESLSANHRRHRMTAIARELKIPVSSCFNILKTLVNEQILDFDPETKTYGLSYGLVEIARHYLGHGGALRVVAPLLEQLAQHYEVTLVVWRRSGKNMVVVDYVDHGSAVRVHIEPGSRFPLLAGAMGRVLGAFGGLTTRETLHFFSRVKWDSPFTFEQFMAEVSATADRGWAIDDGSFSSGISTISVPIFNRHQHADAVLSATSFVNQLGDRQRRDIAEDLQSVAHLIAEIRVGDDL
ncbi:hypothetical protein LL06_03565 [Hoeflea sp. BAL378]|uniref:IclR family transcriptional regulator n=1 Tax=Hoeflea sp. BAL378 TaxID=1547437 RepID=UPI00051441CC|nr:IclR family transcriptional regulator [Hoeflea sp. BAL378]KGF70727.1 hypothetical protein LL06_03565 [Hoeflea sp. BAL378]